MRFTGERQLPTPVEQVWEALHDPEVLREAIPGAEALVPVGPDTYAATLAARVGPVADTYQGTFSIEDVRDGAELVVRIEGRGRFGRLAIDLRVGLAESRTGAAVLRYDARATVGGFVARLGNAALTVAGGHLTGTFFRDLELTLRRRGVRVPALV